MSWAGKPVDYLACDSLQSHVTKLYRDAGIRQVINALRYLVQSGCEWRMLPNDFPPYQTVYYWFRRLMRRFLFRTIHDLALMLDRMCEQREVVPSAGMVDSQSVKAPGARERVYDAHKKISGRKRHITVDTDGRGESAAVQSQSVVDYAFFATSVTSFQSENARVRTCR